MIHSRSLWQKLPIAYQFPFSSYSLEKEPYKQLSATQLRDSVSPLPQQLCASCMQGPVQGIKRVCCTGLPRSPLESVPFPALPPPAA